MGRATRQGLVFEPTADAFSEIEASHDLLWCAAISIWNTRAQVVGLRSMAPNIDQATLAARLAAGSGLVGSNAVTATDRYTWEHQLAELAMLRLLQVMAYYEGWLEAVASRLLPASQVRSWIRRMTFATKYRGALQDLGVSRGMQALYKGSRPHNFRIDQALEPAIVCIRYFKEVRNAMVHTGRRATTGVLRTQAELDGAIKSGTLASAYRPPQYLPVTSIGERVIVTHHGAVGLTGLVQRVLATLDAQIAMTAFGETYYREKWVAKNRIRALPADPARRERQLGMLASRVGPRPLGPIPEWEKLLKSAGVVRF